MAEARECDIEFSFTAAIRGFHVYRREWSPHLGQRLLAVREHGNTEDQFVIAITRAEKDVGIFTTKENIDCCWKEMEMNKTRVLFISISFQLHSNKQV